MSARSVHGLGEEGLGVGSRGWGRGWGQGRSQGGVPSAIDGALDI